MAKSKTNYLMYKGKPFVRSDNIIYYGDLADPCVVMLQVLESSEQSGVKVSGKVSLMLMLTDESVQVTERILKKGERIGLYTAMDLAHVWLSRALEEYGEFK